LIFVQFRINYGVSCYKYIGKLLTVSYYVYPASPSRQWWVAGITSKSVTMAGRDN